MLIVLKDTMCGAVRSCRYDRLIIRKHEFINIFIINLFHHAFMVYYIKAESLSTAGSGRLRTRRRKTGIPGKVKGF